MVTVTWSGVGSSSASMWRVSSLSHLLAELEPVPDQVTVTVNTSQMNVTEQAEDADFRGTSREIPAIFNAYKEMTVPAQPGWVEEHIRRLTQAGIQSAFQCYNINSFESVERLMRKGVYQGPLVMNWVAVEEVHGCAPVGGFE